MAIDYVKENVPPRPPLPWWAVVLSLVAAAAAFGVAALVDRALPSPLTRRDAPPERFIADIAYEHLLNFTKIGPRVAGSYENEVAGVGVALAAAREVARAASAHNVLELDLQRASGQFSLSFFDGMNNVYRDVQNVVLRARGVGGRAAAAPRRTALLLNCHIDTVPDSPGASDDAAGCAVGLETVRALVAAPRPLRHDLILLLNGAEENIMQASHAFITQHKWAPSVRAFINMEACGAGGREVLFQAGPHDPWIVEVYARAVPHPFATSMAQEMFEFGLIPADTDFRIFRDFGKLSGVDLAWSSDGYAYHTALDTAARVPRAALQRTGDNVLALAKGLMGSEQLEQASEAGAGLGAGQPVYFDVLGAFVVVARGPAALAAAAAALALLLLRLTLNARQAHRELYIGKNAWFKEVAMECVRIVMAGGGGVCVAAGVGLALHVAGARLVYYARPALLAPLLVQPALAYALYAYGSRAPAPGSACGRGWWGARRAADALALGAGALVGASACARVRTGYVPWLWLLLPTVADLAASAARAHGRARMWWWAGGWLVPALQTSYLARDSLALLVPLCGRAGAPPLPIDMVMGAATAGLALAAANWLAVVAAAARGLTRTAWALGLCSLFTILLAMAGLLGPTYTAERPQRIMVFHVRRHVHAAHAHAHAHAAGAGDHAPTVEDYYWVPELDANTAATLDSLPREYGPRTAAHPSSACSAWLYCGAAYFLPVLQFVPAAHRLPALAPPPHHAALSVNITTRESEPGVHELHLQIVGPSHVVVIVSPVVGGVAEWSDEAAASALREGARWGARRTYFIALHAARAPTDTPRELALRLRVPIKETGIENPSEEKLAQISVSGHAMSGERAHAHAALMRALPVATARTGWPVHLHLYRV